MNGCPGRPARRELFGITIDPLTMTQAVDRCCLAAGRREYLPVGMVNAAKIVAMRKDRRLRDAVTGCGLVLADGQSVVWASRLLRAPLPQRVAGIDLFQRLLTWAGRDGLRVYFLGARPTVLQQMIDGLTSRYPRLRVAGARDGYFRPAKHREVAEAVRDSGADLLFLGMSSPKKELFTSQWGRLTGASVVHGVGGSFDVLAGVTRRAPLWWQDHGLEWLYRAWQEPARLGPRYLTTNTSFLRLVAAEAARRALPGGHGGLS